MKKALKDYPSVPLEMCIFAIHKKWVKELQLYCYLKMSSDDMFISIDVEEVMNALGVKSRRTILKRLKNLQNRNWIGFDRKTGKFCVRGFQVVCQTEGFKRLKGARFERDDFRKFPCYLGAVLITYMVNQQKKRNGGWKHIKPVLNSMDLHKLLKLPPPFMALFPIRPLPSMGVCL